MSSRRTKEKTSFYRLGPLEKLSESRLLFAVLQALGQHGAVYRTNCGSICLSNGRYFRALPEGFADVMLIRPDGVCCFVETKVKPNKPTDKQLDFLDKMRRLNCLAGSPTPCRRRWKYADWLNSGPLNNFKVLPEGVNCGGLRRPGAP